MTFPSKWDAGKQGITHTQVNPELLFWKHYICKKVINYAGEFLSPPHPGRRFPCFNMHHLQLPTWQDPSDLLCFAEQLRTSVGSHAIEVLGVSNADMTETIHDKHIGKESKCKYIYIRLSLSILIEYAWCSIFTWTKVTLLFYYQKNLWIPNKFSLDCHIGTVTTFFWKPSIFVPFQKPFFSNTKRTIRRWTCPRYMIVNVHNWRRKSFSFETLDDGIHVSPQGVGGPIHALGQGMKLSMFGFVPIFYTLKIMGCCSPKNLSIYIYIQIKGRGNVWHIHWIHPTLRSTFNLLSKVLAIFPTGWCMTEIHEQLMYKHSEWPAVTTRIIICFCYVVTYSK